VKRAIQSLGELPRGLTIETKGLSNVLSDTLNSLQTGLLTAVVVIFLMLAANFQSLRLAFVVISTVPAVLMGVVVMLAITRTTLNVQSFMGAIMAIGVAVANAILLVTFAEQSRTQGSSPLQTAIEAARQAVQASRSMFESEFSALASIADTPPTTSRFLK
jgi:multidrug efflux pump subunit AcrB